MIRVFTPMLILVLLLAACATQPGAPLTQTSTPMITSTQAATPSAPSPTQPPAVLNEAQLQNATYAGIYDQPVLLVNGTYEGEPFVEGGMARPVVIYSGVRTSGDLDGDGAQDAAVILSENSGGSGMFTYLAALFNQDGQPVNTDTVLLGDRVQVTRLSIENGVIVVEMLAAGPQDPLCCPSLPILLTFILQNGKLVKTTEKIG